MDLELRNQLKKRNALVLTVYSFEASAVAGGGFGHIRLSFGCAKFLRTGFSQSTRRDWRNFGCVGDDVAVTTGSLGIRRLAIRSVLGQLNSEFEVDVLD